MAVFDRLTLTGNSDRGHLELKPMETPPPGNPGGVYYGTDGVLYIHNGSKWVGLSNTASVIDSPRQIKGLAHWFDASQITGLADDDRVAEWPDLVGNRSMLQSTDLLKPQYQLAEINSLPALYFDGTRGDLMKMASGESMPEPATVLVVARSLGTPAATKYMFEGSSAGARRGIYQTSSGTWSIIATLGGAHSFGKAADATTILGGIYNSSDSTIVFNGHRASVDLSTTQSPVFYTVGARYSGSDGWTGHVAEICIWHRALDADELTQATDYLANKWGIGYGTGITWWVDSANGADVNLGSEEAPKATLSDTLADHITIYGATDATVKVSGPKGDPVTGTTIATWSVDATLTVESADGNPWYIDGATRVTSGWAGPTSNVYSRTLSYNPYIVTDETNRTSTGLATRLTRNTATPTTPDEGEFGWSSNTLYIHLAGNADPATVTIAYPAPTSVVSVTNGDVTIRDAIGLYGVSDVFTVGHATNSPSLTLERCDAYYAGANGCIRTNNTFTSLVATECRAFGSSNDGFNIHGTSGTATLTDCEAGYNGDEGASAHSSTVCHILRGRYHHNGYGGITHVNTSSGTIYNAEVDHNQTVGAGAGDDSAGVNLMDQTAFEIRGINSHDNPAEGIKVWGSTSTVNLGGHTSGTAADNGAEDDLNV